MEIINVAFAFDKNYYRQAIIAMSSLIDCSASTIGYHFFCLINSDVTKEIQDEVLERLREREREARPNDAIIVEFIIVDSFKNAFECRNISTATYYKLMLHRLVHIDKIIFSDVDVLFKKDLKEINDIEIDDYYMGGVKDIVYNVQKNRKMVEEKFEYWRKDLAGIGTNYINGGFWLLNLKKFRQANFDAKILELSQKQYNFQDQDIINILFINKQEKIKKISPKYVVMPGGFPQNYQLAFNENIISAKEFDEVMNEPAIIHYAGRKPWDYPEIEMAALWWGYVKQHKKYYAYFLKRLPFYERPTLFNKVRKKIFDIHFSPERIKITIAGIPIRIKKFLRGK